MNTSVCRDLVETDTCLLLLSPGLVYFVGGFIGVTLFGGLLTLGVVCMSLLSSNGEKTSIQHKALRAYIVTLSLINTLSGVGYALVGEIIATYASQAPVEKIRRLLAILRIVYELILVLSVGLSDGLLVWRCYMVRTVLGDRESKIQGIFWIFPSCLWVISMGIIGSVLVNVRPELDFPFTLQVVALVSNSLFNLYATGYIATLLFRHRRMMRAYLGSDAPYARHLHIMAILLQSAMINIPMTIAAAVGLTLRREFGPSLVFIAITCQSFASVVIIHQVAMGRAFGERRGDMETHITNASSQHQT